MQTKRLDLSDSACETQERKYSFTFCRFLHTLERQHELVHC